MDEIWLLSHEDGDGNLWAFSGIYSSKELAFKYATKIFYRELNESENFYMEPSRNYDPQYAGGYVTVQNSYDVLIRKDGVQGSWAIFNIEKIELTKE